MQLKGDIIGGLTTFLTMVYVVVVAPKILTSGTGMPFSGVLTATVLLTFSMTLLMGLYAKIPFAVAPGMGISAFLAYSIILGKHVPWQTALGIVFWAGLLFILISITSLREALVHAIPEQLKIAAAVGIGAFLAFIGLRNSGLIVADPATLVKLGKIDIDSGLAIVGFVIMVVLLRRKNPLAFLVGIGTVTILAWFLHRVSLPEKWVSAPDFTSVLFKADILGALKMSLLPAALAVLFTDLFDSLSTFMGVAHATGLIDKQGNPKGLRQGLLVDAIATFSAALLGTASGTAYIESAAGMDAGAKTGRASVVTALCFLPCLFLAPLAQMVPLFATGPVLIVVGALMFRSVTQLKLATLEDAVPTFLTIVLIPLTFSITQGILWGFLAHVGFYLHAGRRREIALPMYCIAGISLVLLCIENL
jgi:adenine/guanine/hypoxanthine permease